MAGKQHSSVTILDEQTKKDVPTKNIVEGAQGAVEGVALTGTAHTIVEGDIGTLISSASASAVTITIEEDTQNVFKFGQMVAVIQDGAGVVSYAAGGGVTVNNASRTTEQFGAMAIIYRGSNVWTVLA